MKHEFFLEPPNLLVMRLRGVWTSEEVLSMNDKALELVGDVTEVNFLADVTELDDMPPKTRETLIKNQMPFTYLKMALVAQKTSLKVLGTLIFKMMPKVKKTKSFTSEEEAREWLKET